MQTVSKKTNSIASVNIILIDPFQQITVPMSVNPQDLAHIHQLADCELFESMDLSDSITLWIDECARLREPYHYPMFKIGNAEGRLYEACGYGLLTGPLDDDGFITDVELPSFMVKSLSRLILWEPWQERIDPISCLKELFRAYQIS